MPNHYEADTNIELHTVKEAELKPNGRPIKYYIDENGCHIAISHRRCRDGYPKVARQKDEWVMSRYIYTLNYGKIPDGLYVRHKCHNRNCINPEHLTVGTQKENMADKKTNPALQFTKKIKRKLTDEEVRLIRSAKEVGITELSKKFDVTYTSIRNVLAGKSHINTGYNFS